MASSLNASVSSNGIIVTGDPTGNLQLQSNGAAGLNINTGGKVVFPSTSLTTASAGTIEYDGVLPYFTPLGTQRGLIPGMQYYRLNSDLAGLNSTATQSVLNVGVTLSSSTIYAFQSNLYFLKTAGSTGHNFSLLYGGTATLNNITYEVICGDSTGTWGQRVTSAGIGQTVANVSTATIVSGLLNATSQVLWITLAGTVSINVGGTFIPQYALTVAPGGAYSTGAGSYFSIYPIGASGGNTNVGTWA